MYLGNQPALSYTSFAKQDFTTSATTSYTLDQPVANANELALFINFVRQEPTTAYTASGTTLTLTSATSASDDMYCVFLGKAIQTVNPPSGSVGTSQLVDDAVTKAKTSALMYPAFEAYQSSSQSGISNNTWTKISANTEKFDTDSMYDATTNYRFTPTVAGKYFVYGAISVSSQTTFNLYVPNIAIYKNGSSYKQSVMNFNSTYAHNEDWIFISSTIELNGSSDYVELYGRGNANTGNIVLDCTVLNGSFGAYRIGD